MHKGIYAISAQLLLMLSDHGILIVFITVQRHELYLGMALYKNR